MPRYSNDDDGIECDHCEGLFFPLLGDRLFSGNWTLTVDETQVTYNTLCNGCHRALVRS